MPESQGSIEIPDRALFKASEVCEIVKVQPYVLRSWEAEFPELGVTKTDGGPRVYRRADVVQVVRIRHLLLVDGLTLAGARRRILEEGAPVAADVPKMDDLLGRNARERLTEIKHGLRSILELLAGRSSREEFQLVAQAGRVTPRAAVTARSSKPPVRKAAPAVRATPVRRRRSA
jgi:DNA-binding transcriptional MerR regulator